METAALPAELYPYTKAKPIGFAISDVTVRHKSDRIVKNNRHCTATDRKRCAGTAFLVGL